MSAVNSTRPALVVLTCPSVAAAPAPSLSLQVDFPCLPFGLCSDSRETESLTVNHSDAPLLLAPPTPQLSFLPASDDPMIIVNYRSPHDAQFRRALPVRH
eukprot:768063-Hanusia_phi.AAC.7